MAGEGDDDGVDALLEALGGTPDDDLAAASARARSHRRWSRQLAAESSTMAGVLLTLAERAGPVVIGCGPWSHRGRIGTVTAELVVLESADGTALLPTGAITSIESASAVADDRAPGPGPDLAATLATLAPERPAVRLQLADGTEVAGTLSDLGKDVAAVRCTSSVVTVRLAAIAGCIVLARGNDRTRSTQEVASEGALASLDDLGSG